MQGNNTFFRIYEKSREEEEYKIKGKTKIAVLPISKNAGAGFIGVNLAEAISKINNMKPAFLDLSGNNFYYQLNMESRFENKKFFDMFNLVNQGENISKINNFDDGINWAIYKPEEYMLEFDEGCDFVKSFEYYKRAGIMQESLQGDICISVFPALNKVLMRYENQVSVSGMIWRDWKLLISNQDYIIFVIDPKPDRLIIGKQMLEEIKKINVEHTKVIYVINKDNSGINKPEVRRFLDIPNCISVPQVYRELIYKADYRCKILWNVGEARSIIYKSINEIIEEIEIS